MPNDSSFVFCSTPFCKLVGGRTIAMFAFDRWRFEDPFAVGQSCVVDIAVGLVWKRDGRKSRRMSGCREGRSLLLRRRRLVRRMRISMVAIEQAFWNVPGQPFVFQSEVGVENFGAVIV